MRFFDYERIYLLARGNSELILEYFHTAKPGYDFIINDSIVANPFISKRHKAEYLGLCALRNYEDYLDTEQVDLSLDLVPPWVPIEAIKNNPLIKLTNQKIILLKENI